MSEAVYQKVALSRIEAAKLVEGVLEGVCAALESRESVKISGFGTFIVRSKAQRIGRNPKTGVEGPIERRMVIAFNHRRFSKLM